MPATGLSLRTILLGVPRMLPADFGYHPAVRLGRLDGFPLEAAFLVAVFLAGVLVAGPRAARENVLLAKSLRRVALRGHGIQFYS